MDDNNPLECFELRAVDADGLLLKFGLDTFLCGVTALVILLYAPCFIQFKDLLP